MYVCMYTTYTSTVGDHSLYVYSATVPRSVKYTSLYKWENEARGGRKLKRGWGWYITPQWEG